MVDVFTLPAFPSEPTSGHPAARHPVEWLTANRISLTKREGLDEEAAVVTFANQLGAAWLGLRAAPAHVQAVCLAAALSSRGDLETRDRLLDALTLASRLPADKIGAAFRSLLVPYLADGRLVAFVDRHAARHGFVNTAAIGLFGKAGGLSDWGGEEGNDPLPLHRLAWLRFVDRTLWYCLQNTGRRAFHIEGAGATAHYLAERVVRTRLMEAEVDGAVEALLVFLENNGIGELP